MGEPSNSVQELPGDLAERLQRLADTRTAGSRPLPRMDLAVGRSRRRRRAGLSALTAAGLMIAGVTSVELLKPAPQAASPAGESSPGDGLDRLKQAGYAVPTGGSLAGDREWLAQVRERVRQLANTNPDDQGGAANLASADEVQVSWAGELNGTRYALAFYASGTRPTLDWMVLAGAAGAEADQLKVRDNFYIGEPYTSTMTWVTQIFVRGADPEKDPNVVFVTGPKVTGAKVATARHFSAAGQLRTEWRSLPREGSVWVGQLSEAEQYLLDLQIAGTDKISNGGGGLATDAHPRAPGVGGQAIYSRLRAIAAAGTVQSALSCAGEWTTRLGGSIVDQPLIAASTPVSSTNTLTAAVLRSPGGPYLVSFCDASNVNQAAKVFPTDKDPNSFMAAIESPKDAHIRGYLVVAPAGATTVTIGDETAKVHHRLAHFDQDDNRTGEVTVKAFDQAGTEIASVRSVKGDDWPANRVRNR